MVFRFSYFLFILCSTTIISLSDLAVHVNNLIVIIPSCFSDCSRLRSCEVMTMIEVFREHPLYEQNLQLNVVSSDNEYIRPITLRILSGMKGMIHMMPFT